MPTSDIIANKITCKVRSKLKYAKNETTNEAKAKFKKNIAGVELQQL